MLKSTRPGGASIAVKRFAFAALGGALCFASACSSDSTSPGSPDSGGDGGGGNETGGKAGSGGAAGKAGSTATGGAAGKAGATGAGGSGGEDGGGACTGVPSTGTNDATHCKEADGGAIAQATGACVSGEVDSGPAPTTDAGSGSDYGDTLYGTEGDDDDCKYHVKYTVAPICEKEGVTFTATVTTTVDGKPVTGAHPYLELTLDGLPPSVADKQKATEKAGGVYDIGPVMFDKPGKWVARFHFFEECSDGPEDSPHGHIAFYISVP